MKRFKQFLKESSFIKEQSPADVYWSKHKKVAKNDYRHSIGLPDEDEIIKPEPVMQGIQPSVEDEARRRIAIEDDVMLSDVEKPFNLLNDTDTPRERKDKLTNRIINSLSKEDAARSMTDKDKSKIEQHNQRRLRQTINNIENDRKAQFPDLAKEQEELIKTDEKLQQKHTVLNNVWNIIPSSPPIGTTKIVDYVRNFLNAKHAGIMNDWSTNRDKQEQIPWHPNYGRNKTLINLKNYSKHIEPYTPNPEFEQTRTFTADPELELPQENEQGIRLGRVDYSRKNK